MSFTLCIRAIYKLILVVLRYCYFIILQLSTEELFCNIATICWTTKTCVAKIFKNLIVTIRRKCSRFEKNHSFLNKNNFKDILFTHILHDVNSTLIIYGYLNALSCRESEQFSIIHEVQVKLVLYGHVITSFE